MNEAHCLLDEGIGWLLTAATVAPAFAAGLATFMGLDALGKRRHALTHRHYLYQLAGIGLGVFLVFPVVGSIIGSALREWACSTL
ncbi:MULTISPECIES: hypothetical protein [Halorhodospira]|uniref:hypothetical protein n=1 Tax=Halorhodospira TaxID=85108 RepID=UPI001EE867F5|nr:MULTISPECIES: hypothetical protein [Halorhodospira]MCG5526828.1 hypothetical protein [Halorhodospira halophila]MCG5537843.1 hypothetical protein [Halorhodospira sp. 9622]MCG5542835.1 hypothetical protein [Halorhodospira sp. 9628]